MTDRRGSAPVVCDQPAGHLLRPLGRQEVTFCGRNDRPLHQNVPRAGKLFRITQPRLLGQRFEVAADPGQVADTGLTQGVFRAHLKKNVDESAGLEIVALEPVTEYVKNSQQAPLGRAAPAPCLGNDQIDGPDLVAECKESENQGVLGGEMPVERGFGHPGALNELIDADITDATTGEKLVGSGEYPVQRLVLGSTNPLGQQSALSCIRYLHQEILYRVNGRDRPVCLIVGTNSMLSYPESSAAPTSGIRQLEFLPLNPDDAADSTAMEQR
jgi:hypothetical protein